MKLDNNILSKQMDQRSLAKVFNTRTHKVESKMNAQSKN